MKRAPLVILICFILFSSLIFAEEKIRYPNVAGQFYPANENSLSAQIDNFFNNVKDEIISPLKDKEIAAIISPHAGYQYSGQVAAHSFKAIKGRHYDTVIILAPSHFYPFKGVSVYNDGFFRTPLGDIEVDKELSQKLIDINEIAGFIPEAFQKEHSLEVELPFLQKALNNFKIVPIVLGQPDYTDCVALARAIIEVVKDKNVLVLASTDLSHYHPYVKAIEMDAKAITYIKNLDPLGLWQANLKEESELCGIIPVLVLLNYAKELGLKAELLNYANSGDVTGDKSSVVGYSSAAFYKDKIIFKQEKNAEDLKGDDQMFNEAQKKRLLEIARQSISEYVINGRRVDFVEGDAGLNIKRGAFVTLHKNGDLRGCIGNFTSNEPIYQVVSQMAIEAATGDPRFNPVTKEELGEIKIEISVLTEPKLIDNWQNIRLGVDGVIVKKGFSQGVFLPQVAVETGWDLETFLKQLCWQKAGLPPESYKDPNTKIHAFQAVIFSEE